MTYTKFSLLTSCKLIVVAILLTASSSNEAQASVENDAIKASLDDYKTTSLVANQSKSEADLSQSVFSIIQAKLMKNQADHELTNDPDRDLDIVTNLAWQLRKEELEGDQYKSVINVARLLTSLKEIQATAHRQVPCDVDEFEVIQLILNELKRCENDEKVCKLAKYFSHKALNSCKPFMETSFKLAYEESKSNPSLIDQLNKLEILDWFEFRDSGSQINDVKMLLDLTSKFGHDIKQMSGANLEKKLLSKGKLSEHQDLFEKFLKQLAGTCKRFMESGLGLFYEIGQSLDQFDRGSCDSINQLIIPKYFNLDVSLFIDLSYRSAICKRLLNLNKDPVAKRNLFKSISA